MLIGVTGGTGYVGAHCVRALQAQGHRIRLLVGPDAEGAPILGRLAASADIEVQAGDVRKRHTIENLLDGCDAVLHAAGVVGTDNRRSALMWEVNAFATEVAAHARGRAGSRSGGHGEQLQRPVPAARRHHRPRHPDRGRSQRLRADQGICRPRRAATSAGGGTRRRHISVERRGAGVSHGAGRHRARLGTDRAVRGCTQAARRYADDRRPRCRRGTCCAHDAGPWPPTLCVRRDTRRVRRHDRRPRARRRPTIRPNPIASSAVSRCKQDRRGPVEDCRHWRRAELRGGAAIDRGNADRRFRHLAGSRHDLAVAGRRDHCVISATPRR